MSSYCGKNCIECDRKEELNCSGCKEWVTSNSAECDIAKCCKDKNHNTCDTCNSSVCSKIKSRDSVPDIILNERKRIKEESEKLKNTASILGKSMTVMFWLLIPQIVAGILTAESLFSSSVVKIVGYCINLVCIVIYSIMLLKAVSVNSEYKTAAYCLLIGGVARAVSDMLLQVTAIGNYSMIITIPAAIVSFVGAYYEFNTHFEVLYHINREMSEKWSKLWKLNKIGLIGSIASLVLVFILPLIGVLVALASAIIVIVAGIKKLIYLYNTSKILNEY